MRAFKLSVIKIFGLDTDPFKYYFRELFEMEIESSKFCPKNLDWFYQGYLVVNKYWETNWSINFIIPFSKSFTLIFSKKSGNPSSDAYPWSKFDGHELHMEIENDATNGIFRNDAKFDFDVLADLVPETLSLRGRDEFWVTWKSNLVHSRPFSVQFRIATIPQLLKIFYRLQQKLQRHQKQQARQSRLQQSVGGQLHKNI